MRVNRYVEAECALYFYKRNVSYLSRRTPKDLLKHLFTKRIVICFRTKNKAVTKKGASIIAGRLDDYWMSLGISDLNIPVPISSTPASELQSLNWSSLPRKSKLKAKSYD